MEKSIQITQKRIYILLLSFLALGILEMLAVDLFALPFYYAILAKTCLAITSLIIICKLEYIRTYSMSELRVLYQQQGELSSQITYFISLVNGIEGELANIYSTSYIFGILTELAIILIVYASEPYQMYGIYLISLIIYHNGEFIHVCFYRFFDLEWKSFLINHSLAYNLAFVFCQVEFIVEQMVLQLEFKDFIIISVVGIIFSVVGHIFRIGAFVQAKSNFHHLVQTKKQEGHVLVTHGLYSISRHPSYFGFFIQSLGSQLILVNPVCFIGYFLVLWKFFYDRVYFEEQYLVSFFGEDYKDYRDRVSSLIPGLDYGLKQRRKQFF